MAEFRTAEVNRVREGLLQEHAEFSRRVLAANPSVAERAAKLGATVEYDTEDDELFIYLGDARQPAVTHAVEDGVYLELDPATLLLVGAVVRHFSVAVARPGLVQDAFATLATAVMHLGTIKVPPSTDEAQALAADLEKVLVAA